MRDPIVRHSKRLSWLLRHGANETGLSMDAAGWCPIPEVLKQLRMSRRQLDDAVAHNNKQRLQVRGDQIRCTQGHSLDGTPVTQDALEASWEAVAPAGPIIHGTRLDVLPTVLAEGLHPMARSHVHLAASASSTVGKRASVAVHLHVDPAKLEGLWRSPNGVLLARSVPPAAILGGALITKRAKAAHSRLASAYPDRAWRR